jgi:hypothetical protein
MTRRLLTALAVFGLVFTSAAPARAASVKITITVRTVPAMAGVHLTLDGHKLTTDAHGRADFTRPHDFAPHTLILLDTTISATDRRYLFARWAGQRDPDQAFRPTVTGLPMRANYTVTAAFQVLYPVSATFVDQSGGQVDPGQVSAATLRGDDGTLVDLPTSGVVWLAGQSPTYHRSTLRLHEMSYVLERVIVNGTNVATGQQRFQPATMARPVFTTQFHDLTITGHDAIFGMVRGTGATVTYPDGHSRFVAFGPGNVATLDHLPRGIYRIDIPGSGTALLQDVQLSKARTVDVIVVSGLDLATVASAGLLLAAALLLIGRAGLRRRIARQARRIARQARRIAGHARRLLRRAARVRPGVTA